MSDNGKILGALVLGAVAGATMGLLFAPDKGSNTRQKIADRAGNLIDQLSEKINESKEALNDLKEKAGEAKGKIYKKAEEIKEQAQAEYSSMKGKADPMSSKVNN